MSFFRYYISCFVDDTAVFSVPITSTEELLERVLKRGKFPINGEPLERYEFEELKKYLVEGVEVGWHPSFKYFLEGTYVDSSKFGS